jgi:hypothetical protein
VTATGYDDRSGGVGLAGVLAEHGGGLPDPRTQRPTCFCGWQGIHIWQTETTWVEQHAAHLADVVMAWLSARAGDAAVVETVARGVRPLLDRDKPTIHGETHASRDRRANEYATIALSAFLGALASPGMAPEESLLCTKCGVEIGAGV